MGGWSHGGSGLSLFVRGVARFRGTKAGVDASLNVTHPSRRTMKLSTLALVAGLAVVTLPLVGCAAPVAEGSGSSDDAFTGNEILHDGDAVFTTANLNLREKPSTSAGIITVIPKGSSVTLSPEPTTTEVLDEALGDVDTPDETLETPEPTDDVPTNTPTQTQTPGGAQGTDGFYHVTFGSTSGWAFGKYLSKPGAKPTADRDKGSENTSTSSAAATSCMTKAAVAGKVRDGQPARGRCYHSVKEHIGKALGIGFEGVQSLLAASSYRVSAYQFARWVDANPAGRASGAGFVKSNVSLDALPKGAILVWQPGQCGYNATHGHIEVNIGGGRACSDFCGTIKRSCGQPTVILIQKNSCGG
jgi:hypothetical protein